MENMKFCQSCGMPMGENQQLYGTNKDGSENTDYCVYCFKDGEFTANVSMEEMIEFCVPHMVAGNEGMTEEIARQKMKEFFPMLRRWQTK
ncbi:zinc ribbon domain-containing protein [Haloimpatiens massiliensis]|uniref:zinc ribbon domain-containing protein n=1 Tax=Haloimpatiens massiliensis TaxID=1658110 RepID=UPI000C86614C|nr:zinc ribbon domain-containing protein [Haloimpatiens massiliensis]